jgi:protein-tyrosine-phosphatase
MALPRRRVDVGIAAFAVGYFLFVLQLMRAGKTVCLDPDGDIPDPIGHGQDVYRECLAKIRGAVRPRLDELPVPA